MWRQCSTSARRSTYRVGGCAVASPVPPRTAPPTLASRKRLQGQIIRARRRLVARDYKVLRVLHRLRLLTARQLARLFFYNHSPPSQLRRTQALLKRLHELGLVSRSKRIVGGIRAGSSGFIYSLTGLGQAVIAVQGPYKRRRKVRETKPAFQDHVLAVSELYVRLVEVARLEEHELLAFEAEPGAWRRFIGPGGEAITLKPDAFTKLATPRFEHSLFVEVDLASESLGVIRRKCERYIVYWRAGLEQQCHGVFPRVVWLVPDDQRRRDILAVVGRLGADVQALFAVLLYDDAHQPNTKVAA